MPTRPPRLRPLLLALAALPAAAGAVELGVRAYDSHAGGALSRPPCPHGQTVPCPLARHALPAHGRVAAADPATGEPHACAVNSLGLRGDEVAVPKPAGRWRMLVSGDGATLAAGLPAENTFAGRLASELARGSAGAAGPAADAAAVAARTEVLNAAVPGDCPLLSVLRLRTLASLQPDLVLLCVRPSDLAEDARYRRDLLVDGDGRPVACPHPAFTRPGGCESDSPWWRRSLTARLLARRATACAAPAAGGPAGGAGVTGDSGVTDAAAELALAPLAELARVKTARGFAAAVVILPESPGSRFADDRPAAARIAAAAAAAGLPAHDAAADFAALAADPARDPAELMTPGGRLTAAGHARLAAGLAAFLLTPRVPAGPENSAGPAPPGEPRPPALGAAFP